MSQYIEKSDKIKTVLQWLPLKLPLHNNFSIVHTKGIAIIAAAVFPLKIIWYKDLKQV